MSWSIVQTSASIEIAGLLAFMERWRPGNTQAIRSATPDQIARLAAPHGGVDVLPPVYRDFLRIMGESTGEERLTRGSTSISDLLADRDDQDDERPDPTRYLKFSIGEDYVEDRNPDYFFDLSFRSHDGRDAAILRIHENHLAAGSYPPATPFRSFSDLLRSVFVLKLALRCVPSREVVSFALGTRPDAALHWYEMLSKWGFTLTELGASACVIPLENQSRGAIAMLNPLERGFPTTFLQVRARDEIEEMRLTELIRDHMAQLQRTSATLPK